jgi:hypothetical protein
MHASEIDSVACRARPDPAATRRPVMTAMQHPLLKPVRHAAVALATACACSAGVADPVRESFDRLLAPEATPTP